MATKVDELIVEIKAETSSLNKGLKHVNRNLKTANKTAQSTMITFANLAKVFAIFGFARLAGGVISTIKSFEDLEATLQANTGNAEETARALQMIETFTATTTFQIEEVTEAFIELRRKGISATRAEMDGLGKVAAANNTSIKNVAEGVTRAATTSVEQLMMMGFVGKMSGDQITLSYGENADKITQTMQKTSRNVMKFVAMVGDTKFDEAIVARSATVTGAFSNMSDHIGFFAKAMGQGGLKQGLVDFARGVSLVLVDAKPLGRMIGGTLTLAFRGLATVLGFLGDHFGKVAIALAVFAAPAVWAGLTAAVIAFAVATKGAAVASLALGRAMLASPITWFIAGFLAIVAAGGFVIRNIEHMRDAFSNIFRVHIPNSFDTLLIKFNKMRLAFNKSMDTLLSGVNGKINKLIGYYNKIPLMADMDLLPTDGVSGKLGEIDAEIAKRQAAIMARTANLRETDFESFSEYVDAIKGGFLEMIGFVDTGAPALVLPNPEEINEVAKSVSGLKGAFEEMKEPLTQATQAFTGSFVKGLMDGKDALGQFANFAKDMVAQIITTFLQLAVVNQILNSVFGLTGDKALTTLQFGGNAGGGTVQAGKPTLVGERGPELFVPNQGGTIVNNMNSKNINGGGGTVIHQSINFATGVVPTVRAEVMKMMPQIAAVTKGAVAEGAMRGGSYRKALVGG